MKKNNKYLITSFLLLLFTVFYIFALKTVDVQPIGPQGTEVGFATLNKAVSDRLLFNQQWYRITKYLGYAAFAVVGIFVLCGLIQLIRRRSLSGVDRKFYALAGLYAVTAILYVTFEHVIINYRPVIMPDNTVPEASFPAVEICSEMSAAGTMASAAETR